VADRERQRSDLRFQDQQPFLQRLVLRWRNDVKMSEQIFRGKTFWVAQDPVSLQYYRFGPQEHAVVALLDGTHTLGQVHETLAERDPDASPFSEVVNFVFSLRQANLLQSSEEADDLALHERAEKKHKQERLQKLSSLLYPRIPIFDPEKFLNKTMAYVRFVFSRPFKVFWWVTMAMGLWIIVANLGELGKRAYGVLAPENLVLLWIAFAGLKSVHELGHAYAAKNDGVEVHRLGILFLVFTPCLFTDVTGMWQVDNKYKRAFVGFAGMYIEFFIACWALLVWHVTEPGLVNSLAYNVFFIAGISSVLFNGNPLLMYDGYYILSDLVDIPNLRWKSWGYLSHLAKKLLLGLDSKPPAGDAKEKTWFVGYGILSFCYRILVVTGVILFVSAQLFIVGVLLAVSAAIAWVLVPLGKLVHFLLFSSRTRTKRLRCAAVFVLVVGVGGALIGLLPVPEHVRVPCVVEPVEQETIRARWPGFVQSIEVSDGQRVKAGDVIVRCSNKELEVRVKTNEHELAQLKAYVEKLKQTDPVRADAAEFKMRMLEENLDAWRRQVEDLVIRAPLDGTVVAKDLERIRGRYVRTGEELAMVATLGRLRVIGVLDQKNVSRVKDLAVPGSAEIKLLSAPSATLRGRSVELGPRATYDVPSLSLTNLAGGPVIIDPSAPSGNRTLLPWFRVEIELDENQTDVRLGTTGEIRFTLHKSPLAAQWYTGILRFLRARFYL